MSYTEKQIRWKPATQNDKNSDALAGKLGIQYTEKGNICPVIGTHIGVDAAGIVYAEK